MRKLQLIILIVQLLLAATTVSTLAQKREKNTASARAAYGLAPSGRHHARKVKKVRKNKPFRQNKDRDVRATRTGKPHYRKKSNWAS